MVYAYEITDLLHNFAERQLPIGGEEYYESLLGMYHR
jgi:hypothetical protein